MHQILQLPTFNNTYLSSSVSTLTRKRFLGVLRPFLDDILGLVSSGTRTVDRVQSVATGSETSDSDPNRADHDSTRTGLAPCGGLEPAGSLLGDLGATVGEDWDRTRRREETNLLT